MKPITEYKQANDFLNRKHIQIAYQVKITLENMGTDFDNIMYVAKKDSYRFFITPTTEDMITRLKAENLLIAEIPFKGFGQDFNRALIEAANAVKTKLGDVSLADVTDIEEASKDEILKLKTRLGKSKMGTELDARKSELETIIGLYEDKESDTEREDLAEHWANIRECLEEAQNSLEQDEQQEAIDELEDALGAI